MRRALEQLTRRATTTGRSATSMRARCCIARRGSCSPATCRDGTFARRAPRARGGHVEGGVVAGSARAARRGALARADAQLDEADGIDELYERARERLRGARRSRRAIVGGAPISMGRRGRISRWRRRVSGSSTSCAGGRSILPASCGWRRSSCARGRRWRSTSCVARKVSWASFCARSPTRGAIRRWPRSCARSSSRSLEKLGDELGQELDIARLIDEVEAHLRVGAGGAMTVPSGHEAHRAATRALRTLRRRHAAARS